MNSKLKKLVQLMSIFFSLSSISTTADAMENEYARKAEILKHLIDTIVWPQESIQNNTINICIWGKLAEPKPFTDLNGIKSEHYKINIRQSATLDDTSKNCQIIFVSKNQEAQAKKLIQRYAKKPILLLGDMENFARIGGSMNFMKLNNGLALSVNLISMKEANLQLDLKAYSQITIIPDKKDLEE